MYYDTYSTSFQSLMKPMYNVQANYNAYANNLGSYGMNGMYGMGMGYMSPMMNVGVGQFNADYLVKNDDRNNNYYTRPVAAHVHKDETPTILGILATALGTAALIAGLAKGRGRGFRRPTPGPTPRPTPGPTPRPTPGPTPGPTPRPTPGPTPGPTTITDPTRLLPESSGKVYARKWNPRKEQIITPSRDIIDNTNYNNLHRPGTMFGNVNNPISDPTRLLPEHESQIRGLLNPHNSQIKGYLADPTGRYLPVHVATNKTNLKPISEYLPKPENKYNLSGGIKGFLPAHNENVANPLQAVNQNLSTIRPDLMRHGKVVYTTHTNESISSANSIGANAKGADKLAELLKQMQG